MSLAPPSAPLHTAGRRVDPLAAPPRRGPIALVSVVVGLLVTSAWSAPFVDTVLGHTIAGAVLGHDPASTTITGAAAGLVFAFAAGAAGTFTACNIAAFSALAPMMSGTAGARTRVGAAVRPLSWVAAGALPVSAAYGAVGALAGPGVPQLSAATIGNDVPVRLVQSMVVYGVIGLVLLWMGLAALRYVPDPFGRLTARHPRTPLVVMGVLIGLFLVGRPYPLFRQMFTYAAETRDPLYGALSFLLVAVGNVVVMAVLFAALALVAGQRLTGWLSARQGRVAALTGAALLVAGVFTVAYWVVRLLSRFGYGWFPTMPWV